MTDDTLHDGEGNPAPCGNLMLGPNIMWVCPKCGSESGDAWQQCEKVCPLPISPHYSPAAIDDGHVVRFLREQADIAERRLAEKTDEEHP